jgi:hypothetical protein
MTVTPLPLILFLCVAEFGVVIVFSVSLIYVHTIGAIFVVIPVVIVPVVAVIDSVVVVVAMMFFLASVVLRLGRRIHCGWDSEGCS